MYGYRLDPEFNQYCVYDVNILDNLELRLG